MTTPHPHPSRPPAPAPLAGRLARLANWAETSRALFAAPLGPAADGLVVPRFVVFGDHTTDTDARIVLLAGFDAHDFAAVEAALAFVESAAAAPAAVGGVVLDVVPALNRGRGDLWNTVWPDAARPELRVLERELRRMPPHAVIQLRTNPGDRPGRARVFGTAPAWWLDGGSPDLRALDWEAAQPDAVAPAGVAGLVDDLPFRPLELHLALPAATAAANVAFIHAVVQRIRGILSHAQHL